MKYFEMFAGVGGFSQGLNKDKFEPIGFSEIDKYASQVLKYHYPNTKNYGNCETIRWSEVPDFDLLTGGSPCQNFSIAGKREGIVGSKSKLVWEFIRCLNEKQPRYFIWENVKGALSSRNGWDFANILTAFSEAGYSLWWQVLNAKDFGVPQNRERIFVIGFREGSPKEVFFERETNQLFNPTQEIRFGNFGGKATTPDGYADTLTKSYGELSGDGTKMIQGDSVMRIFTPIECERLMGWADNWTKFGINEKGNKVEISDSQRYKMCGNGVVSSVIRELVKTLF